MYYICERVLKSNKIPKNSPLGIRNNKQQHHRKGKPNSVTLEGFYSQTLSENVHCMTLGENNQGTRVRQEVGVMEIKGFRSVTSIDL